VIQRRKEIDAAYRERLTGVKGIRCLRSSGELVANYSYFPVLINRDYPIGRDELYENMKASGFHPRRYFYPLISDFPMYRGLPSSNRENLPVASQAASQVLCLPIYPNLNIGLVEEMSEIISSKSRGCS
jgi:dTDP-4-amino-4,6-dideoxygalactose transaminase